MTSHRYVLIVFNRSSGALHRFTFRPLLIAASFLLLLTLPILIGLGARWSATAELDRLRASNATLQLENSSYRAATEALTTQISSLQATIDDLGVRATLDPASARAVEKLPAVVKARAMGGRELAAAAPALAAALTSPQSTFGVLQDLLGVLEGRLRNVSQEIDRRQALADATPSIWPAHGWLSAGFGHRADPFTGDPAFHPALDISTDRGQPVYATAWGTVTSASYSGAYGNLIVIDHGFGLSTRYAHLSRFTVKAGDRVRRGEVIGLIGSTGRTTGPHLHYEVWGNGRPLNPLRLLISRSPSAAD
jgi:murein DD-endopeptidase MepM/ murein hydrolase activator NlpD